MSDNPRCPKCDHRLSWCICKAKSSDLEQMATKFVADNVGYDDSDAQRGLAFSLTALLQSVRDEALDEGHKYGYLTRDDDAKRKRDEEWEKAILEEVRCRCQDTVIGFCDACTVLRRMGRKP